MNISVGSKVAWQLAGGATMAGVVTALLHGAYIKRVDGTVCGPITEERLRPASYADVQSAIRFYTCGVK